MRWEKPWRYVERQHVEVDRLVAQGKRLSDQDVGVLEKIVNIEFIRIHWIAEFPHRARDLRREKQEQHDVCDMIMLGRARFFQAWKVVQNQV